MELEIFGKFSESVGVANIREYEEVGKERKKQNKVKWNEDKIKLNEDEEEDKMEWKEME